MHLQNSPTPRLVKLGKSNPKKGQIPHLPLGVFLYFDSNHLKRITLKPANSFEISLIGNHPLEMAAIDWFHEFFNGRSRPFPLQLPITQISSFTLKVWEELQRIPFGKTKSYQEIAIKLNHPYAARAVGNACGANLFPLLIPCHRVIRQDRSVGGFAFGSELKKTLLQFESISH